MSKSDSFFSADQYATVAERIEQFYSRYGDGRITTELISRSNGEITFKALVYRTSEESPPAATGWASEREGDGDINAVACLENTETSAVGRALANLGFTASSRRPSREEMEKVARVRRTLSIREARRGETGKLGSLLNVSEDVLQLLSTADQKGFPPQRSRVLRQRVTEPGLSAARVRKIEGSLRTWVRRHEL